MSIGFREDEKLKLKDLVFALIDDFKINSDVMEEFLCFQSSFYQYSFRNSMLIYKQNPYATFVASATDFKNRFKCKVVPDAKPIKIIKPVPVKCFRDENGRTSLFYNATPTQKQKCNSGQLFSYIKTGFTTMNVYDITQTDYPKENYPKLCGLNKSDIKYTDLFGLLEKYLLNKYEIKLDRTTMSSVSVRGEYNVKEKTVRLSSLFDDTNSLCALFHEVGHVIFHTEICKSLKRSDNKCMDHHINFYQIELEADLFSILACVRYDIKIPDFRLDHAQYNIKKLDSDTALSSFKKVFSGFKEFDKDIIKLKEQNKNRLLNIKKDVII